ncbi:hypothetical protein MHM98_08610 [Psychrobium sp. MM17-31]|uniref:hypothetical protein n=1 Tax=Psychrobium sp. MM17-31 TaxID=2917758 RepID=UPI001EF4292F|nr:hypothetical protein [Psychrobium sp. MM17-31]MCG7531409.1 hypothetical protein [Psychrobium sp. MM17-31]
MTDKPKNKHVGTHFTVEHCDNALESFEEALLSVSPHKRKRTVTNTIIQLIERLADGKRMSRENFPQEGSLPRNGGKFNAFKKIPVRAYCWLSLKYPNTYFISHYTYKDKQKLDQRDIDRVHANWNDKEN